MSNFCKNCGAQLKPETKFCASCGTKTQEAETSSVKTVRTISEDIVPEVTKSRILPKKLLFSAVAVVLVIALGVAILPRLGKEVDNTDGTIGDLSSFVYTERDYTAIAKELTVSPESPSASAYGVTIEFGEYALEEDETLKVRELPEKGDKNNCVKVTAYDFELGAKTNFDDVIIMDNGNLTINSCKKLIRRVIKQNWITHLITLNAPPYSLTIIVFLQEMINVVYAIQTAVVKA